MLAGKHLAHSEGELTLGACSGVLPADAWKAQTALMYFIGQLASHAIVLKIFAQVRELTVLTFSGNG